MVFGFFIELRESSGKFVAKKFGKFFRVRLKYDSILHVEFYEVCTGYKFIFSSFLVRFEFVKVRLKFV